MKRGICMATLVVLCATGVVWAAGPGGSGGGGGGGTYVLSPAEEADLIYMREEEKLARDVYDYFADLYDLPIFANISSAEQRHMDAILTLLIRYGVDDPAAGMLPGEFTDAALQALYDQFIVDGGVSLEAALEVGVTIEETDIADLELSLEVAVPRDLIRVYENLLSASEKHLAAFTSQLESTCLLMALKGTGAESRTAVSAQAQVRHQAGATHRGAKVAYRVGSGPGMCDLVRVEGLIAAIDPAAQEFVVGDTTIVVTEDTIIKMRGRVIEFADLAVGQTVAAAGAMDEEVLIAARVTVRFGGR